MLHECLLTGQTSTWYLQMCSINKWANIKQKLSFPWNTCLYSLGKCYILIIVPLSCLCCNSAQALHFSVEKFLPPAVDKNSGPEVLTAVCKWRSKATRHRFPRWATHLLSAFFLLLFIYGDKCQLWTEDLWDRKDKAQFTNHFPCKQTGAMTVLAFCNWISCCYLLIHKKMSTSRMLLVEKVLIHYDFECGDDIIVWVLTLNNKENILKYFFSCNNKNFPYLLNEQFIRDNVTR